MQKWEPSCTVGVTISWYSHYAEQYAGSLKKLKIELPYDPTIYCWAYILRKSELKKACTPKFFLALFTIARTWRQSRASSIDEWIKKDAICIYNGILLSYKKECTSVHFNEVNKSIAYYTEWSKSERKKQISYINTYIWKLELWYWWTYLQDNKREANKE